MDMTTILIVVLVILLMGGGCAHCNFIPTSLAPPCWAP